MSVRELIEYIKRLPREEQTVFAELFHQWERSGNGSAKKSEENAVVIPDFAARRRRIFGDKVAGENLVIAVRREERW